MKHRRFVMLRFSFTLILISTLLSLHPLAQAQHTAARPAGCKLAGQLLQTLRVYHVDPPADDTQFSGRMLQQFVQYLDPHGLYLSRKDVADLNIAFQNIGTNLARGDCSSLQLAQQIYSRQYRFVDSLRQELLSKPVQLGATDTLQIAHKAKVNYVPDQAALMQRWKRQIAYSLLYEAYNLAGEGEISLAQEPQLREKVKERLRCRRSKMLETPGGLNQYVEAQFLQAIASAFDPHTTYMPPATRDHYVAALSAQSESFGIELEENAQGDIQIARLVPGGPAWKSNELHEGDVLLRLRTKQGTLREFGCLDIEEAEEVLTDAAIKHGHLTVRKKSGQISTVELKKEPLRVEENVVSSFIMDGPKKVGYLALPSFYTQLDGSVNSGAAQDLAKEIVLLKRAGIEGLILDLRFNGGGSVMEALGLAGIFIDEGPLGVEASKGEKPRLLKDLNRGVLYNGPLILLVNGFSASASEIITQALQDYNRALVVGSPTYGKATMQVVIPVNNQSASTGASANEPFVKVTIGKYYSVKSSSYQAIGILPDVPLADGLSALGYSESAYPTALRSDLVNKKLLFQPLSPLPVAELYKRSQSRLQHDKAYLAQQQRAGQLARAAEKGYAVRLTAQGFKQDYTQLLKLYEDGISSKGAQEPAFTLTNGQMADALLKLSETRQEANKRMLAELNEDVWLSETYRIMLDLLELQNR